MEVAEVRRRLRGAIDAARKTARERRARADLAAHDYERFLAERAVPVFQTFASALVAEGFRFAVFTPADSVRLASESVADDFIELALDATFDPPAVVGRISRGRGRRRVTSEHAIREGVPVSELGEEDVLAFLAAEIGPFVER